MNADRGPLHAAADILLALEHALRAADLWHERAPTPAAMASRTPFCADTLMFSEWLQFVFLPRMRLIIENDRALPAASGIAVMGREALAEVSGAPAIVAQLQAFDRLIETGGPPQMPNTAGT
ncbi:tRNA pseudouridine synthase C [Salinisphaera orenii MK-B5]|uniref:tRNA pseudouridine synthase C n=1 Tax=Salinisphaera orenii MK-B5 TaxID=856730 RepID=A0A423PQH4_9GAMM|nr:YqcC family protein [Salinisphaera orenii]ROO27808.1 tRNA pseudouridine synthase C [Salinisphaera orenii MK-B5]